MSALIRTAAGVGALGGLALGYGGLIERNLFTLRRFAAPVLDPGTPALRVLHLSDLHLRTPQRRKQAWIRKLAELEPDFVVNTGDTSSDPDGIPAIMAALGPLFDFPGAFVPGNNDYYAPAPKNPARYFMPHRQGSYTRRRMMPWDELAASMASRGWLDLTHVRREVTVNGVKVALAGTDDPPALLASFAEDGYDLVLAGHTHGGQIRVPFGPAIVTNCGIDIHRARWLHRWDEHMWFNVCAGLGTNPYMPVRIGCRPEAVLLTLLPR
jgi:hypothetical protein